MKTRIQFILKYFLFWLLFFLVARILFMAYEFNLTIQISAFDWFNIFIRGAWMDISLIGYVLLISGLALAALTLLNVKWIKGFFKYYTAILIILFSIIIVSDLELYRNWGFRIDATPLFFLKTPGEAFASTSALKIIVLTGFSLALISIFIYFYGRLILKSNSTFEKGRWWYIPTFVFFSALMIIPIRGNFGIAPMNPGKVYYSQNMYCNHAALNPIWNMMYSLSKSSSMYKKYPDYIEKNRAKTIAADLMADNGKTNFVLNDSRPNVVLILLESFNSKNIETLGGLKDLTPNFNELSKKGILFSRIYASGDRSDKGIVSVISGFPAQPTKSVIKYPLKSQKLPTISSIFDSLGYSTAFYYGGNPDFANIRSYLYSAMFERLITQDDFPKSNQNSKWGAHDEYVFDRLLTDCDTAKAPFFKMIFTLTSHEPFEIPTKPKFKGNDDETKYLNSIHYADSCLGSFISKAHAKDWYQNTLFILIADHGHYYPGKDLYYFPKKFAIPMLWVGGALNCDSVRINKTGSQVDLASTLLSQLKVNTSRFKFSKNLLSDGFNPFAYYVYNDGMGFVNDSSVVVYDHISKKFILKEGIGIDKTSDQAFSFLSYYQEYFLSL